MTDDPKQHLLPGSATAWERAQSKASARLLETDTDAIRRQRDPAQCATAFLPLLANERSVHHYAGDLAIKRARVASSFADHLAYGTPAALEAEISADIGAPVRIVEFFEDPRLEWPDFIVESVIDPGDDVPDLTGAFESAIRRKNVRDWPVKTRVRVRQPVAPLNVGAGAHMSTKVRIMPFEPLPPPPQIFVGAGVRMMPRVVVQPLGV